MALVLKICGLNSGKRSQPNDTELTVCVLRDISLSLNNNVYLYGAGATWGDLGAP